MEADKEPHPSPQDRFQLTSIQFTIGPKKKKKAYISLVDCDCLYMREACPVVLQPFTLHIRNFSLFIYTKEVYYRKRDIK